MYLKVMTDTCKQTDIDKNVVWRQICAFLAIQLLLMARSPELPALCINPERDGRAGPDSPLALTPGADGVSPEPKGAHSRCVHGLPVDHVRAAGADLLLELPSWRSGSKMSPLDHSLGFAAL